MQRLNYIIVIISIVLSIYLQSKSQIYRNNVSKSLLHAMRLRAISIIEKNEINQLNNEALYDYNKAMAYEDDAKLYAYQAKVDHIYAIRNTIRAQYYEQLMYKEENEVTEIIERVKVDDSLRLEILTNLTTLQEEEDVLEDTIERNKNIHSFWCENRFFQNFCYILGNITGLEEQVIDEKEKIIQETKLLNKVEKREYLDELVLSILQGKVNEFNQTSQDLYMLAEVWDKKYREDTYQANIDNITANEYYKQEQVLEKRIQASTTWEVSNEDAAIKLIEYADIQREYAYYYSLSAIALSIFAIIYLIPRIIMKIYSKGIGSSISTSPQLQHLRYYNTIFNNEEIQRKISTSILHVLILLLVIGITGNTYLLHMLRYNPLQRAVIVVWFGFVAGCIQTIFLQTIPHVMAEWPLLSLHYQSDKLVGICIQSIIRLYILMTYYIMEFLIIWLTLRNVFITTDAVHFFSTWFVRFIVLGLATLHIVAYEPRQRQCNDDHPDEQSTVLLDENSEHEEEEEETTNNDDHTDSDDSESGVFVVAPTESSPLMSRSTGGASSSSSRSSSDPTKDLPYVYFREMVQSRINSVTTANTSPYTVQIQYEAFKILFIFEMLLLVCAISILRKGLSWIMTMHPIETTCVLIITAIIAMIYFYRHQEKVKTKTDSLLFKPCKCVQTIYV